jgi:hypothetical protein
MKSFGPQIKSKQIEVGKKVKKLIHYDCNKEGVGDEDIPDEDEVYIKENLLQGNSKDNNSEYF